MTEASGIASTVRELARGCGVGEKTVRLWLRRHDFPWRGQRQWPIDDVRKWARARRAVVGRKNGRLALTKRRGAVESGTTAGDEGAPARSEAGGAAGDAAQPQQEPLPYNDPLLLADLRGKTALAEQRELENQRRRGELIEREAVARMFAERAAAAKKDLRALARRLSRRLCNVPTPVEVQRILEDAVDDVLKHWSADAV